MNIQSRALNAAATPPQERWLRIIPTAFVMYTIAYIDRTNISMALSSMSRELHMTPTQAGGAAGVFFWGYLLLQIPGGYIAERWSAKRFVGALLVAWGICSVGCAFVHTTRQFWVMRFLLGVTEGGVWPATLVLLSHWFPRAEHARANAYWMLCQPASVILSGPLSGWILSHWGWRVLLASEGALPFVWLVFWWRFINDHPHQAAWISASERGYLESTLLRESAEVVRVSSQPFLRTLIRPKVLLLAAVYILQCSGAYGFLFWLPSALKSIGNRSDQMVGFLFAVPYLLTAVGMVFISRHSDRTHERRLHVVAALALAGVFLLSAVLTSGRWTGLSFLCICLVGPGVYGMLGPFWAIPAESFPRAGAGSAMGMINIGGSLGGYIGPVTIGYISQRTGNIYYAFTALSLALIVSATLMFFYPSGSFAKNPDLDASGTR
jgi:MFS family permease